MITESKVTEIFCIADDFCKEFESEISKKCASILSVCSETPPSTYDV